MNKVFYIIPSLFILLIIFTSVIQLKQLRVIRSITLVFSVLYGMIFYFYYGMFIEEGILKESQIETYTLLFYLEIALLLSVILSWLVRYMRR